MSAHLAIAAPQLRVADALQRETRSRAPLTRDPASLPAPAPDMVSQ